MARVLVIEDHENLRTAIRQILEDHSYIVADAATGKAGVALLRTFAADLAVVDTCTFDQDGSETIRVVRRKWPQVKLLAISGWQSQPGSEALAAAQDFGAHGVLTKPFGTQEFLRAVETVLTGSMKDTRDGGLSAT